MESEVNVYYQFSNMCFNLPRGSSSELTCSIGLPAVGEGGLFCCAICLLRDVSPSCLLLLLQRSNLRHANDTAFLISQHAIHSRQRRLQQGREKEREGEWKWMRLLRALICVGDFHIAIFCDLLPSKSRQRSAVIVTIGYSDISLLPKKHLSVIKIFGFCIVYPRGCHVSL